MPVIDADANLCTVIVRFAVEPGDQPTLLDMARRMQPVFARQPGFVGAALHRSTDGTRIVQYLQWRSADDHQACMENPEVAAEGEPFMRYLETGKATMEVHDYVVDGVVGAGTWQT